MTSVQHSEVAMHFIIDIHVVNKCRVEYLILNYRRNRYLVRN